MDSIIKNEKVLSLIKKRLNIRVEEKNKFGEVFTPVKLICEMFQQLLLKKCSIW